MHQRTRLVIGRHGAVLLTALRLRVGLRHQIISRTGRAHNRGNPLKMRGCFAPPCGRRGALEERRRPFGDPFRVRLPVSEGRMALPTPFETKRKKAPMEAYGRIQHLNVAEGEGFEPSVGLHPQRFSRPPRSTAPASLRGTKPVGYVAAGRGLRNPLAIVSPGMVQERRPRERSELMRWMHPPNGISYAIMVSSEPSGGHIDDDVNAGWKLAQLADWQLTHLCDEQARARGVVL
jgi:hypothetical protein